MGPHGDFERDGCCEARDDVVFQKNQLTGQWPQIQSAC